MLKITNGVNGKRIRNNLGELVELTFWSGGLTFAVLVTILRLSNIDQPFWVMPLAFLMLGITLFRVRCRRRIIYGLAEIMFCLVTIGITFLSVPDYNSFLGIIGINNQNNPFTNDYTKLLGGFSGLYIIVRGLDNIDQGLNGKISDWDNFFKGC